MKELDIQNASIEQLGAAIVETSAKSGIHLELLLDGLLTKLDFEELSKVKTGSDLFNASVNLSAVSTACREAIAMMEYLNRVSITLLPDIALYTCRSDDPDKTMQ